MMRTIAWTLAALLCLAGIAPAADVEGDAVPEEDAAAEDGSEATAEGAEADTNGPAFRYEGFKRIECNTISNVVLRAAHYFGTNEVIYRIGFGLVPTPYYFVRLGDFIGEYEIVESGGRRGEEWLLLRKGEEEWVLPRAHKFYQASPSTVYRKPRRQ
ncbi:MAG: hypothetical protein KJ726_00395 [Verrucomicrobia bacterium]|nr:hypothetical protein [Verrucomicrobiota bacterium]MBU1908489.1 hypothetical protein [Verrucomicrobiota bacterium]